MENGGELKFTLNRFDSLPSKSGGIRRGNSICLKFGFKYHLFNVTSNVTRVYPSPLLNQTDP